MKKKIEVVWGLGSALYDHNVLPVVVKVLTKDTDGIQLTAYLTFKL